MPYLLSEEQQQISVQARRLLRDRVPLSTRRKRRAPAAEQLRRRHLGDDTARSEIDGAQQRLVAAGIAIGVEACGINATNTLQEQEALGRLRRDGSRQRLRRC